jgi:hypothetical protein
MVPNPKYFPSSLAERAAWYQNFTTQFTIRATDLGFTPADVDVITTDNAAFQFLLAIAGTVDSYEKAMTAFRRLTLEGDIGTPGVEIPLPPTYPPTPPTVDPGLFERLDQYVKRIRVAPGYSEEDGAALGIIPSKAPEVDPNEMKPDPSLIALPGNIVEVTYVRGKTDGIDIQMLIDKATTWENVGRYKKSPVSLQIPVGTDDLPRSVQIRARYVINDVVVGQYSDIDTITTIP